MKIIIGAGNTKQSGWTSLQEDELNVLKESDWEKICEPNGLSSILSEHVWEHMTFEEGIKAAQHCYKYLKPGGYIRCVVPDRNFKNEWYQNIVQVGGPGPKEHPAASHKIVYDYKLLTEVFKKAEFEVDILEYCDENNNFHYKHWNEIDGKIGRSFRFDTRNSEEKLGMVSIIIDAKKPLIIQSI